MNDTKLNSLMMRHRTLSDTNDSLIENIIDITDEVRFTPPEDSGAVAILSEGVTRPTFCTFGSFLDKYTSKSMEEWLPQFTHIFINVVITLKLVNINKHYLQTA